MDEELERLLAADLDDGDALAVPPLELGLARDLHLLEIERQLRTHPVENPASALAEVASLRGVQADGWRRYG
jgi:hypothetical protein